MVVAQSHGIALMIESVTSSLLVHGMKTYKPGETTHDVAWKSMDWRSSDGLVIVCIIAENGSEIS
jgi:hypothetical protein